MNSKIGLPVLIGSLVFTALLAVGVAFFVGRQTAPAQVAAAPAPIPAPVPVAAGAVDPNTPRVIVPTVPRPAHAGMSEAERMIRSDPSRRKETMAWDRARARGDPF